MIWAIIGVIGGILGAVSMLDPARRWFTYQLNQIGPNNIPEAHEIIDAYRRGLIDYNTYKEWMKYYGYDENMAQLFLSLSERLLTIVETITLLRRGYIDYEEAKNILFAQGVSEEEIHKYLELTEVWPTPSDIIRFAVREVFNPEVIQKYGYAEEFPEEIVPLAEAVGIMRRFLEYYWMAHWEVVSPSQAYEMLHRLNPDVLKIRGDAYRDMGLNPANLETDLDTVRDVLKIADYPPYWRDRLVAIAYNPLTRVDLRRIYALGLIDDEELVARLMELGYTRKDAELMAEFYKKYKNQDGRDLTLSQIRKAFEIGMIDRGLALELLKSIGYSEDEANFLIDLWYWKLYCDYIDEIAKGWVRKYEYGLISKQDLINELTRLGLSQMKIDEYVMMAEGRALARTRLPTKEDLINWVKKGVITKELFEQYMKRLGYSEEIIKYYEKAERI